MTVESPARLGTAELLVPFAGILDSGVEKPLRSGAPVQSLDNIVFQHE
jgi:hypothetical protein